MNNELSRLVRLFLCPLSWDDLFLDLMKLVTLFFCTLFIHVVCAQNLVPNSGFEKGEDMQASEWIHLPSDLRHYEQNSKQSFAGLHYQGLCISDHSSNEWLSVPLLDTLIEGNSYCFKMHAYNKLVKRYDLFQPENINSIHIVLSSDTLDIYDAEAQDTQLVFLTLPKFDRRQDWFELEGSFVAGPDISYLSIGYFKDVYWDQFDPLHSTKGGPALSQNSKKRKKDMEKHREEMKKAISEEAKDRFRARFYFDEICLTEVVEGQSCSCELQEAIPEWTMEEKNKLFILNGIQFRTGSAELLKSAGPQLDSLVTVLMRDGGISVTVHGHTDNVGSLEANIDLSMARAKAVQDYLLSHGISSERIHYDGFGSKFSIGDNGTEKGRAMNRRVEFLFTSRGF